MSRQTRSNGAVSITQQTPDTKPIARPPPSKKVHTALFLDGDAKAQHLTLPASGKRKESKGIDGGVRLMGKERAARKIRMQQDNAPPHTGKDMVNRLNLFGKAMPIPIEVEPQPSNSPETNTLDLCVFNSWCRRNHKLQKFAKHKGKEVLMDNLEKSWAEYPAEILERAWQNKCLVIDQIIKYNGGNYFRVPHVSEEAREKRCPSLL